MTWRLTALCETRRGFAAAVNGFVKGVTGRALPNATTAEPGEFSFGEDQGCTETDGRKGHRSGTIGDSPAVLMTIRLDIEPGRGPCRLK